MRVIDNGCKDAGVLVDFYYKLLQQGYPHQHARNMLWCIPTSSLTYVIIKDVFEQCDFNTDHILFKENVSCLDMNNYIAEYARTKRVKGNKKMELFFNSRLPKFTTHMFDYCISNPPYQLDVSTGQQGTKIYPNFFQTGSVIAEKTTMIFLSGWLSHKGSMFTQMRSDKHIMSVDLYEEKVSSVKLFPTASTGGVTVVHRDNTQTRDLPQFYIQGVPTLKNLFENAPEYKQDHWFVKHRKHHNMPKLTLQGAGQNGYAGVPTKYIADNPHKFIYLEDFVDGMTVSPPDDRTYVKLVSSSSVGKTGRAVIYTCHKSDICNHREDIDTWKVVAPVSYIPTILPPGVTTGRIRPVVARCFGTHAEAAHLFDYVNTRFVQYLRKEAPDLQDYTNDNPDIDWNIPLDNQLYILFGLTQEEIKHIENYTP